MTDRQKALEAAQRILNWQCASDGNAIDDLFPFAKDVARALLSSVPAADAAIILSSPDLVTQLRAIAGRTQDVDDHTVIHLAADALLVAAERERVLREALENLTVAHIHRGRGGSNCANR